MPGPERVNGMIGLTEEDGFVWNGEKGPHVVRNLGNGCVMRVPHEPDEGDRSRLAELNASLGRLRHART